MEVPVGLAICWAIWLVVGFSGHGTMFPWPLFVMLGTGIRAARIHSDREDIIAEEARRLEKKERKSIAMGRPPASLPRSRASPTGTSAARAGAAGTTAADPAARRRQAPASQPSGRCFFGSLPTTSR